MTILLVIAIAVANQVKVPNSGGAITLRATCNFQKTGSHAQHIADGQPVLICHRLVQVVVAMPVESRTHGARVPRPDENEEEGQEQQEAALLIEPIDPFPAPARASSSTANATMQALRLRWGWLSASAMIVVASLFLLVKL